MFTARGGPVFDKTGMDIIDRRQKPEGEPIYGFLVLISQLSPKSKGYVKVTSADPTAYPEIDANYLEHPDDLEVLVRGMKHLRTVAATEPIKSRIQTEVYHSAIQNIDPISQEDAYFAEYVRWAGITVG
jgi:choline dehydrogenase